MYCTVTQLTTGLNSTTASDRRVTVCNKILARVGCTRSLARDPFVLTILSAPPQIDVVHSNLQSYPKRESDQNRVTGQPYRWIMVPFTIMRSP